MADNKNNKRGGIVGKLLVAAMTGALAGGTMVACSKEEKKEAQPAAAPVEQDKAGAAKKAMTPEAVKPATPATGAQEAGEKKEGHACNGAGKCAGMKAEGAAKAAEGAAMEAGEKKEGHACNGEAKEAGEKKEGSGCKGAGGCGGGGADEN